jgi:hypothetical protein
VTDLSGRCGLVSFDVRNMSNGVSHCALPHSPSYNHSKKPQEESIARHTVAGMSLVCPEMRRLNIKVE